VYSPRLWPATAAGAMPRAQRPIGGDAHRENARLRVLGQRQFTRGTIEAQTTDLAIERAIGGVEHRAGRYLGLGELLTHARVL